MRLTNQFKTVNKKEMVKLNIKTIYKLTIRIMCDMEPKEKPPAGYLFSQTESNQNSVLTAALDLYRQRKGEIIIGIVDGKARSGYPGFEAWRSGLVSLGVNRTDIFSLPCPPDIFNTFDEAQSLIRLAKERKWLSVFIISSPFHQVRCFISAVTVALAEYPKLKIYNKVGTSLNWDEEVIHSQGMLKGRRKDFIEIEIDKLEKYKSLMSPEKVLEYLENRDKS